MLSCCDLITKCLHGANHNMGLKFLGLRRRHIRPYFNGQLNFNGPKQPEFHYAAALNVFMYMYVSCAVSVF